MTQIVESMEHVKDVREAVKQGTLGRIMLDATILVALCDYAEKLEKQLAEALKQANAPCSRCSD